MDSPIIWAILLLAIALALFFAELFVPSGGLISFLAACSLIAGIVLLFIEDPIWGLVGSIVSLLAVPFLFAAALKIWPNTPIARILLLKNQPSRGLQDQGVAGHDSTEKAQELVGQSGQALTDLRPVGTCLIAGKRTECLADGGLIRSGTPVKVIAADGMHVRVREEG